MKPVQYFTRIIGIIFTVVGVMGFIAAFKTAPATTPDVAGLSFTTGYGDLLGLFPVNVLHNIVHLVVGVLGIVASVSLSSARLYSGMLAIFYGLLTLMGLFPPTQATLGLIPIFGNDIWLHGITAAIAIYFGFIATPDLLELSSGESHSLSQK
ncbi:DUF4383 domain-containing protein [Nostoc sp. UHCC 0302]|uniref:DUF4383 domain-containing protein n=1 Tax=Nostoc sp. UHCC 0302 TaxID=3134896 RepID=UPI00311CD9D6